MTLVRILAVWVGMLSCGASLAQADSPTARANTSDAAGLEQAKSPIGTIDLVDGTAQLIHTGQSPRAAVVGLALYEGDTLATGEKSEVHATMLDTGFIVLRPNSRVRIVSYKADAADDDQSVLRLVVGGLRSITGWIGKFNRKSYLVRTPTATIGVRGTDHETRVIPPGSTEGEAGTYDKVFAGETSIQSSAGITDVTADHAGYAPVNADQRPRVLASVPGFFRPGPHEDLINKKHAEIQKMIDQRREERRKVLEEKRAAMEAARKAMQSQVEKNKAAAAERAAAEDRQQRDTEAALAAIGEREKALQEKLKAIQNKRAVIREKTAAEIARSKDLRERIKIVRDTFNSIARGYRDIQDSRKALVANNARATEARKAAAEEQRRRSDQQLAAIGERWRGLREKFETIQDMNQAVQDAAADPRRRGNLSAQRQAVRAATDAANKEQRDILDAQHSVFENSVGAAEARMAEASEQRRQTALQFDEISAKEEALRVRQQQNEAALESIQAIAGDRAKIDGLREQLQAVHEEAEAARSERREIQRLRKALRDKNMAAVEQRANATAAQLKALREKHQDVQEKSVDVVSERESMQKEIRTLYEQEERRYREELRLDRLQANSPQANP